MTRLLSALLLSTALAAAAGPAAAQDDRRVADLQRQVRELRAIVFQGRDTGQPVEIKPVGPDPQVVALQGRVDELSEGQRRLTGQNEELQHSLDESRRTAEQLRAEAQSFRAASDARVQRLEQQLAALQAPPPATVEAPPAPVATLPPVVQAPASRPPASRRAQELTARTQAGDTSTFGGVAAGDGFDEAYQRLVDADYAGAQAGFEGFIARKPTDPRVADAKFYIGQSLYVRETYGPAARAYAEALKGWPKTKWAPDATVKLAQSLNQLNQNANACAALAEFNRRYGPAAPAAVKTRAAATRTKAQCTAG